MKNRAVAVNNLHGVGGSATNASRHIKAGKVAAYGGRGSSEFAKLGISKPMMAPPAVLSPNSMFDSKMALFVEPNVRKAS